MHRTCRRFVQPATPSRSHTHLTSNTQVIALRPILNGMHLQEEENEDLENLVVGEEEVHTTRRSMEKNDTHKKLPSTLL